MKPNDIYAEAYRLLNDVTPVEADCGQACGKACCETGDPPSGMYLFPFEDLMYRDTPKWIDVQMSDFEYYGSTVKIAFCDPPCDRDLRPLGCRIFPLFPYIDTGGEMTVIMDPRGLSMCPLARRLKVTDLDPIFVRRVEHVFKVLLRFDDIYAFIFELSRYIEELKGLI